MAATKSQGATFTGFAAGITIAAAGLAYVGTGIGKLALAAGLVILAAHPRGSSLWASPWPSAAG
jgi:hypothetical protein